MACGCSGCCSSPVVMSVLALLAIAFAVPGQTRRKALLWTPALALLVFCVVGIFSIGLFYLPALVALLVAAVHRLPEGQRRRGVAGIRLAWA